MTAEEKKAPKRIVNPDLSPEMLVDHLVNLDRFMEALSKTYERLDKRLEELEKKIEEQENSTPNCYVGDGEDVH